MRRILQLSTGAYCAKSLALAKAMVLAGGAVILVFTTPASADSPYGRPIYNPASKSYFELRADNSRPDQAEAVWSYANARASALQYKGVRGRLAVVTDPETHNFLARNFKIDAETWIGLRYWCTFRKLTWVDSSVHEPVAFSLWASSWHRHDLPPCVAAGTVQTGYMSVYYTASSAGFRWQAVGSSKGFRRYFVEYPTGEP